MITEKEKELFKIFKEIKRKSGTHSPSIVEIRDAIQGIDIKVDACYLSNPYATDLFLKYLSKLDPTELRGLIEHYPSQNRKLSEYVSAFTGISPRNIVVGNGASEIISFLMYHYIKGKTLLPIPTFSPYYEYASPENKVIFMKLKEEDGFCFSLERMRHLVETLMIDNIVLVNPNNPNGCYIPLDELETFIDEVYDLVSYIILDESFIHFVEEDKIPSTYKLFLKYPKKLIIIKSMSKDFGIAGLRVGYAVCDSSIVDKMIEGGFLWNVSGIGEYFLRTIAYDADFRAEYERKRKKYISEARRFFKELSNFLTTYPTRANFVLAKVPIDPDLFSFLLLYRYGVYVRSTSDKIGLYGNYVRISARTSEENKVILEAIENLVRSIP